jgi:CRISPR/Cas system-associated protein endoribonuclease Cas2
MVKSYYCTEKRCQTEIDYLLGILPTKEMVINQVEAIIFDLSEFEETNPNQLRFWRKVLSMLNLK